MLAGVPSIVYGFIGFALLNQFMADEFGLPTCGSLFVVGCVIGAMALPTVVSVAEDAITSVPGQMKDGSLALAATGGGFALFTSLVILTGVIDANWAWQPDGLSVAFTTDTTVPLIFGVAGLLLAWVAAQASAGFGTQGKARGASLLVSVNAAGMVALLVVLVSFIAIRGWGPMTEGIRYGLFWGRSRGSRCRSGTSG